MSSEANTEVWIRNPAYCILEAMECGIRNFIWDSGYLAKRSLDPVGFIDSYWVQMQGDHRTIVVGSGYASEYSQGSTLWKPNAVYPQWKFGEDLSKLENFMKNPVANDPDDLWWQYPTWEPHCAPNPEQEHRVIVSNLPAHNAAGGEAQTRKFLAVLMDMQADHPECIVHLHGSYSYAAQFGMGFGSVDIEPRVGAAHEWINLPSGRRVYLPDAWKHKNWLELIGFTYKDLKVPRNRCMFNMKSAVWASRYYAENVRFAMRRNLVADYLDPDDPFRDIIEDDEIMMRSGAKAKRTDKWLCNTCSLQFTCKFFREGAVCAVPDSEPPELAEFFHTRDSGQIIEGLGTLLASQTRRLNKAMQAEEEAPEKGLDPEVTKLVNSIFDRGVKLAKLVDPKLAAPRLQLVLNQNRTEITAANPQQLMAAVAQELAARGIPISAITPEMVMTVIAAPEHARGDAMDAQVQKAIGR